MKILSIVYRSSSASGALPSTIHSSVWTSVSPIEFTSFYMFKTFVSNKSKCLIVICSFKTCSKFTLILKFITYEGFIVWVFEPSTFMAGFFIFIIVLAKTKNSYFSKFYGRVGVISWLLFHLIWKNYVLYWDLDTKQLFQSKFQCRK